MLPGAIAALRHRGPDAEGRRRHDSGVAWWELLHTRLSILDLSPAGNQPMSNEDDSLVMVFNGEIYNSPDLRRFCEAKGHHFASDMDGEVILHLWEMEGAAALRRLNGIFAVAVASTTSGEVVLARDPLGVKPLFYSVDQEGSVWFASELAALRAADAPVGGADTLALAQFLSFLWIPDPRTPLVGARSLEPGQAMRWTPRGVELFHYGERLVPPVEAEAARPRALVEAAHERFSEAACRQLLSDVPIGLMASGGVDSGLIWRATHHRLERAYTIEWPDGDDVERLRDDRKAVTELASRFGTEVDYLSGERAEDVLPPSGDLFADPAYALTRLIAGAARERGCKVLLSGQGGDELLAGYRRHAAAPLLARLRLGRAGEIAEAALRRFPSRRLTAEYLGRLARASAERDPFAAYMRLCTYSTARQRAEALGCTEGEVDDGMVWQRHREVWDRLPGRLSVLRKAMGLDLAVYLPGLGLAYVDRAGMEFGVEIRVPWLDLDFVRWTLALPDDVLVRRGRGKWLTRQVAARELSPQIAHRPKRAFAAPARRVGKRDGVPGHRGFRQGAYFGRARRILDEYLGARPGSPADFPERPA